MKQWTQHEARPAQLVEADQFNDQHREFRGQMTGLDRAQYPVDCLADTMIEDAARHKVWTFVPWDTGVTDAKGEQTAIRSTDANTLPQQFRAVTYQEYGSGWITAYETTLTPFRGGSLLTDWCGCSTLQAFFTWTSNAGTLTAPTSDKYIGLRILYNGVVVVERLGPAKPMDSFRLVGESQVPSGDVTVTFQFQATSCGPDDPIEEVVGNKHLVQAHIWANRVVCVGRWR